MIDNHQNCEKPLNQSGIVPVNKAVNRGNPCREQYIYDNTSFDRCSQCGYEILPQEEALKVYLTGDIIHRSCWSDYAEDSVLDLCDEYFTDER